jgi:hypothetical protein
MIGRCKSCGAHVVWAKTASGKSMPVDATPNDAGNLVLDGDRVQVVKSIADDRPRHTSHFVTCPQSDRWRKR